MVLLGKKTTNTATALYNEMIKYSRSKSVFYQSVSPIDIKKLDNKIKDALMDNPSIAVKECYGGVPFILACVDCGMKESVKWFLSQKKIDRKVTNVLGENIATYAFKVGLDDILDACNYYVPELLDIPDDNGLTVRKRIEIREKEKELGRR